MAMLLFMGSAKAQSNFIPMPSVPPIVQQKSAEAGIESFIKLWQFALEVDGVGDGPAIRINFGKLSNLFLMQFIYHRKH